MKNKPKKKNTFFVEAVAGLVVALMLFLLMDKYYGITSGPEVVEPVTKIIKLNPRFSIIDSQQLEREASSLVISSSNKKAESIFVLTYHVISNYPPTDDYEISYDQFKDNMFALKSRGYNTVSLEDLNLFLNGEKDLPDKSFLITFDDGAKAAYYNADPVLKALNYTAVMFVITGQSFEDNLSPYYMNETELVSAQQTGRWELESHTHQSHFRLPINSYGDLAPALTNKLWIDERLETNYEFYIRVDEDITRSKEILETKFNKTVTALALPYGDFGERGSNYGKAHGVVRNLTTSKFKLIFYEFPMKNKFYKGNYPVINQEYQLVSRLPADTFRTPETLLARIEASGAIQLPYIEDYSNNDRWPRVSGVATFENDFITLRNREDSLTQTNLMAYLDGSFAWRDYTYTIQLVNNQTSLVSLISRVTINANYVSCQYSSEKVTIINSIDGVHEKIKIETLPENTSLSEDTYLSMSVFGPIVRCYMNGENIISARISNIPSKGGVGIKMEDYNTGNKTLSFGNISIIQI